MNSVNNKHSNSWFGAGLITAFTASLCCVVPVAAFLAGIGSLAVAFSWVEPLRPCLIGLTTLLLGWHGINIGRSERISNVSVRSNPLSGRPKNSWVS